VLPNEAFKEVARLRLPFPLLFTVDSAKNARKRAAEEKTSNQKKEEVTTSTRHMLPFVL
jgi:hypothetical protein